jgi:eukaryotic-like serine/threonine-protein kinase|mmetsp:Transcript_43454/g.98198  ORF Transcript_43454/g.98198 Transcript_43454/m.98198 type:complete len:167 (-) Transcript_43454:998-1498(-)
MPLPLVAHVPSTARSLYSLDELETVPSKKQQIVGKYTLVEHLGSGSSGCNVFAATHPESREVFAIKVHRGGCGGTACALPRFMREAELTCLLNHPHVVTGIESGIDGKDHYVVMKLLRGKSLAEILQDCGRLDWRTATTLVLHVARALAHLKSLHIVHRDVRISLR